ncbi:MAG: FAD:protein FMN transferase [Actinobacteria bacterium]|nr:FAD:protein FMN transferase [Actinomycetota bacterium]
MNEYAFTTHAWSSTVRLVVTDRAALQPAATDLVAMLARIDAMASRFRSDSDLSRANARAGKPTPVPMLLCDLVTVALDAAARTDGLVDPTVGADLRCLGYDRDISEIRDRDIAATRGCDIAATHAADNRPAASASWRRVRLDRTAGLLTVPVGVQLDLGATAKAFTADHAARTISHRYGTAALVELGGDVAVAGHHSWCLAVAEHEGGPAQRVTITRGGMATSTTTLRRWSVDGECRHHILDPRTAEPAFGPWRTVAVYGESALQANIASTAAIVLGEGAQRWLTGRHLAARLVAEDGSISHTRGWPQDRLAAVA